MINWTEDITTRGAGVAVGRAQPIFTSVTCLCVCITSDRVTDDALYPVRFTDIFTAGITGFEMVSAEPVVTEATAVSVSWASEVVTIRTNSGVISADNVVANPTRSAVSLADLVTTGSTWFEMIRTEPVITLSTAVNVSRTD